mmetsp:Transcript_103115/g.154558  ORF Transcript_103115/g.154558 Transcript_103115/m.154558 type:complete len:271 (+) Transcript_103115:1-813(+)
MDLSGMWTQVKKTMKNLPQEWEKVENECAAATKLEKELALQQKELEEKLRICVEQKEKAKKEKEALLLKLQPWHQFRDTSYDYILDFVDPCEEVENEIIASIDTHMKQPKASYKLASLNDSGKNVKLSLVFNGVGLSHESISKLCDIDGEDFMESSISSLCTRNEIPFSEQLELNFIRSMLNINCVPNVHHEEECAVCVCSTEGLRWLIEEHKKKFDFALLEKFQLNGKQFLGLTRDDFMNYFSQSKISTKELVSTVSYFRTTVHDACFT